MRRIERHLPTFSLLYKPYLVALLALSFGLQSFGGDESDSERGPASTTAAKPMGQKEIEREKAEAEPGLLGDWGGAKSYLSDKGLDFELAYKADLLRNLSGGTEVKSGFLGNVDAVLTADLEKLFGLEGWTLNMYGLGNHGDDPTDFVGDSFAASNIEAPDTFKLYEAYLQKDLDEHSQIAIGLRDLNAIFNVSENTGNFINSAFGITPVLSQTGENGPSIFPTTALAIDYKYESAKNYYFQMGIFNAQAGDPNKKFGTQIHGKFDQGYLLISEFGFARFDDDHAYKYAIGAWSYSKAVSRTDGNGDSENDGLYLIIDQKLANYASLFVKYGIAQEEVNTFASALEVGFNFKNLFSTRPDDEFGVGFALGEAADDHIQANSSESTETAIEIFYKAKIADGLYITPDYQFLTNPGLSTTTKDSHVGVIRIEMNL